MKKVKFNALLQCFVSVYQITIGYKHCAKRLIASALLIALNSAAASTIDSPKDSTNKGDRPGDDMTAPIPADQIPPAPVLNVEQALKSIVVQDGFIVENVAAEPLVQSPVDIAFDANGRIWMVEMQTFMPDLDANNEEVPEGRIVLLEDRDADGKADKRTVFLNDVVLPRTISMVKGGILYASHEQLHFAEILADNSLGLHEVVDPEYAKGGTLEHKPNAMHYSLDNWYYNAKSNRKYKVVPLNSTLPAGSKEIYRNKYWKMLLAFTDNRGQWGISSDDYGRLYHNGNSSAARGEYLRPGALMENPGLQFAVEANTLGSNHVFPIRINPGVNRAYLPNILVAEGPNKGKLNKYTAASGNNLYRGDQFPQEFYGVSFTPEPAGNLISVRRVTQGEGKLEGAEIYPQAEILASTDERFRPVNLNTAPDGTLYIVDMYHGVIQHAEYLTTYLREQYESRDLHKHNSGMGRIYRLRWAERPLGELPNMKSESPQQWVAHLEHANGWWRDMARQLIVQNYQQALVPQIKNVFKTSQSHVARINALWTLEGLDAIDIELIESALLDKHRKVKVAGIELSTRLSKNDNKSLAKTLFTLHDNNYELGLNVALVAGQIDSPLVFPALEQVLNMYGGKPYIYEAVINGLTGKEKEFATYLDAKDTFNNSEFTNLLANVGRKDIANSNVLNLSERQKNMYKLGKALYDGKAACFGCHGQDGEGINSMGPPLANSEWVIGKPETLVKILLHGLMGPITVGNKKYDTGMIMPGFAQSLTDEEFAQISTYIRNNWGNKAHVFGGKVFAKIRKETSDKQLPYTEAELIYRSKRKLSPSEASK
ncbi:PVC-type heme-binding CxxCH protein [Aliiglaciecola sp. SL4]|uniref:PVC-type heme-binding CxxCH protein n=1 Tax=Aliiglaciecola sp. SL4 TaxID=3239806 RepID=UPI00355B7924